MRLRQRPPRALGADWVQPRHSGRSTTIGNLDSPWRAAVDPAGLLTLADAEWSLDWWIGAEDRWHLACREVAVRQSLQGGSPVVETRLRVPSGDAVHRAYAARDAAGAEVVVVEIENSSKLPFAVALALRPHTQRSLGRIDELSLAGTSVRIDGHEVMVLPRSPGRVALADGSADSAAQVFDGQAEPATTTAVRCPNGLAQGALLFPLAHTAVLRVVLPGPRTPEAAPVDLSQVPTPAQVASGWSTQAGQGARIEVPDRRLRDAVSASTRHLLLGQGSAAVAAALDLVGFPNDAARALVHDPTELARTATPGAALHAVTRHWELTRDLEFAVAAVELVAVLGSRLRRSTDAADQALGARALQGAASLLEAAGQDRAARDAARAADAVTVAERPDAAAELAELLSTAGSTWTWPGPSTGHDPDANAALVTLVRDMLVDDAGPGLHLSATVPETWLGQGWELHDAPTSHGRLSYAVRWHGDRPALLWHLEPHDPAVPVTITAGLDAAWSTTDAKGEALLSPVAIPERSPRRGLSMPVTIEPMPRARE